MPKRQALRPLSEDQRMMNAKKRATELERAMRRREGHVSDVDEEEVEEVPPTAPGAAASSATAVTTAPPNAQQLLEAARAQRAAAAARTQGAQAAAAAARTQARSVKSHGSNLYHTQIQTTTFYECPGLQ